MHVKFKWPVLHCVTSSHSQSCTKSVAAPSKMDFLLMAVMFFAQ